MLSASAFAGVLTALALELVAYQRQVVDWARRDLQSRADLAAANLAEPLRTQDFAKIHAFGDTCQAEGYRLSVLDANGRGRFFDTARLPERGRPQFSAESASGEYRVRLWIPSARVLKPFYRALVGISLAGLVGVAGVLLFFFVTYRQRVRIRELARLEEFRRAFIADLSHEIKTPLTGILGAVDMLEGDSPLVPLIRKESRRLNALVQQILDLARLERGRETLSPAETDLAALVRETVDSLRPQAESARVALRFGRMDAARRVCDPQRIAQALENLIVNAIRHAHSPEVVVSLAADGDGAHIRVEDHGCGIPPEHAGRVFERFHRVDPARAAESGGAGLGLAIVRRIARLHGGDVTLEPAQPQGSRFTLSF